MEQDAENSSLISDATIEQDTSSAGGSGDELLLDKESEQQPTISIVMPTLNEEEGVAECIQRAKRGITALGVPAEIILSDSSTDRTPDIGQEMGAIVYEPDKPGYGYAYRYAFARARGEYIVMGDADTTYDFEQIPRLLERLQEEDADIVMGSRLEGEIKSGAMPTLHQYVGNPLLTRFLNTFYDAGVSDAHSGFRIFTREALETMELDTTGMEFASEMIMEAGARDLDIVEVPIVYHEREGEETLDSFRDGWRHVRFMLENAPGYLFSVPGLGFSAVGLLLMILAATGIPINGVTLGPHSMIAGSLCVIIGYQAVSLGAFATLVGNPIRQSADPFTTLVRQHATLERGGTAGIMVFGAGAVYAGVLVLQWIASGFQAVPFTTSSMLAFTAIVLGLQTVFYSFFLSAVGE